MAAKTTEPAGNAPQYRPVNRWAVLGMGVLLGFVFGSLMWLITGLQNGWRGWLYIAITTAMLGGGVSAAFGVSAVRKRGERISPRLRRRR